MSLLLLYFLIVCSSHLSLPLHLCLSPCRKSTSSSTNQVSSRCATRTRAEPTPGPRLWRRRATAMNSNSKKLTKNCRNYERTLLHSCKKCKRLVVSQLRPNSNVPFRPKIKSNADFIVFIYFCSCLNLCF